MNYSIYKHSFSRCRFMPKHATTFGILEFFFPSCQPTSGRSFSRRGTAIRSLGSSQTLWVRSSQDSSTLIRCQFPAFFSAPPMMVNDDEKWCNDAINTCFYVCCKHNVKCSTHKFVMVYEENLLLYIEVSKIITLFFIYCIWTVI